jgi:hypothetical protein
MTAAQFEEKVEQAAESTKTTTDVPQVCSGVIELLRAERLVTRNAILRCEAAYGWAFSNSKRRGNTALAAERLAGEEAFVRSVVPLLTDRPFVAAELLHRLANMELGVDNQVAESRAYKDELAILQPFNLKVDFQRIQALVRLGQALLAQRRTVDPSRMSDEDTALTKEAEQHFQLASVYPWYTVRDPRTWQDFRDTCEEAIRGIIDCRRGNLKALQETTFAPAFEPDLRQVLDRAIEEAKQH